MCANRSAVLTVLMALSWPIAAAAADSPCIFYPTKDFGSDCDLGDNRVNAGGNYAVRMDSFCSGYYADFDRDALGAYVGALAPGEFRTRLSLVPRQGGNALSESWYWMASWYTGCDWDEGDGAVPITNWGQGAVWGDWHTVSFNWTKATGTNPPVALAAPTKWYSKTYYTDTDGIPDTGDEVLATGSSQAWVKPDGTVMPTFADWSDPDPRGLEEYWFDSCDRLNSGYVEPTAAGAGQPWNRYEMRVDDAVMNDLLGDVSTTKCRGVWVKAFDKAAYTPTPGVRSATGYINLWMFTREADAVNDASGGATGTVTYDYRPYLDIRRRGDANSDASVDVLDLTVFANNFGASGAAWEQGDFNEDGEVDVLDLTIFANRFGWTAGGEGMPVPEPAAGALLAGAAAAALGRRRRRRPATP